MKYSVRFRHQNIFILVVSLLLTHTSAHTAELVLQSLSNVDNEQIHNAHEGNSFKLIKIDQGCKIETHFYLSNQNQLSHYIFIQKDLLEVARETFRYHYQKGFEGSIGHVTDIYLDSKIRLDTQDPDVKKDFHRYKALFPNKDLKLCDH